jgi:hypothetical protein
MNSSTTIATVYNGEQEFRPVYDDVLAEPRLDKQLLLKCNPDHQMFPLPHHHHLTLLRM